MHHATRIDYLDNLRALAMLAGVLFHAALAYSPLAQPLFPTADRDNSLLVDVCAWFLHLFRMPVFFLVAGYFTALQTQDRGLGGMLRSRLIRIGLPLLLFAPLIHAALRWSTLHAVETAAHPSPLLLLIRELLEAGPLPAHPPGTGHLWFLYYLLFFLVLVWVARCLGLSRLGKRIAGLSPVWPLAGLPLLMLPALASVPAPHPAPESLLPQFWAFAYYGPFFALGYLMQRHPACMERLMPHAHALLAGSLALYVGFLYLLASRPTESAMANASWPLALIEALISVWMTIACLAYGRAFLDRSNRLLRYAADASYWTYLVHLPILFAIQYRLMDLPLPWTIKFAVAVLATLAACLLSYQLLVRHTRLAMLLGGRAGPAPVPAG